MLRRATTIEDLSSAATVEDYDYVEGIRLANAEILV